MGRFVSGILILLVLGGGYVFRDYLASNVGELRVGDCFDEPAIQKAVGHAAEVNDIQHRPCAEVHDGEVYAVLSHPGQGGATYPSDDTWDEFIGERCEAEFAGYLGRDYTVATELEIAWYFPTASGWSEGDREITCYVYSVDGRKLDKSLHQQ